MKKWTSFLTALMLTAALALEPMALTPLREQVETDNAAMETDPADTVEETVAEKPEETDRETPEAEEAADAAAIPTQAETPESALLNQAALGEPQSPSSQALDQLVSSLMDGIVTDEMTTYDKVRTCYDYVTDHTSYGNHMAYMSTPVGGETCWDIYQSYGDVEGFGAVALTAGKGMCNAYASAFILMARRLGLDARLVKGYTLSGGGSYAYHEWAEVVIDGMPYVFDPQLDQDLTKSGLPAYSVFCKSYAALGKRYQK